MGRADRSAARAAAARRRRRGGFAFGIVVGAVAGLLMAPKSGKETRQQLLGDSRIGSQVSRIRGALGAGKDSAADQSDALRRKIEETRERLRSRTTDEADAASV